MKNRYEETTIPGVILFFATMILLLTIGAIVLWQVDALITAMPTTTMSGPWVSLQNLVSSTAKGIYPYQLLILALPFLIPFFWILGWGRRRRQMQEEQMMGDWEG